MSYDRRRKRSRENTRGELTVSEERNKRTEEKEEKCWRFNNFRFGWKEEKGVLNLEEVADVKKKTEMLLGRRGRKIVEPGITDLRLTLNVHVDLKLGLQFQSQT